MHINVMLEAHLLEKKKKILVIINFDSMGLYGFHSKGNK